MIEFTAAGEALRAALGYATGRDAILDPRGRSVRCTPRRRTVLQSCAGVEGCVRLYRKLRYGALRDAEREWRWLHALPRLGFTTPEPICFARAGRVTALVVREVAGRPLPALLREAGEAAALHYALAFAAPLVARLHAQGLVYRDMYWQHWFAVGLEAPAALIDVERTFRPWLRWRRWVVKDLAGLVASWPWSAPDSRLAFAGAFVDAWRRCGGGSGVAAEGLVGAVLAKAGRIAGRRPKYG